jgi:uncharacterized repeat protein (TIGR03803 family)
MDLMSCVAKQLPRVVLALLLAIGLVAGPIDRGTAMSASRFVRREAPALVQTVLEKFDRLMHTGANPSDLIEGAGGVLYGTTYYGGGNHDGGTVFALAPPPPGKKQWTETILYSFFGGNFNSHPTSVIADSTGALYGEAGSAIFKLTPPTPGSPGWTESVLYQFRPENYLTGGLLVDAKGDLFGVTELSPLAPHGTVFELIPPTSGNGPWTKKTLYAFTGGADGSYPIAGVSQDATGALYGTTYAGGGSPNCGFDGGVGCGVVFRLTPPAAGQTAWTESVLFAFNNTDGAVPFAPLLLIGGAVYGTTTYVASQNSGEIFQLTPPNSGNGPWNETILYEGTGLAGPSVLFVDGKGNFYGLNYEGGDPSCRFGCGSAFKLSPPVPPQTVWTLTTLFAFNDGSSGYTPVSLLAGNGVFYGATDNGGLSGHGTVYSLKP